MQTTKVQTSLCIQCVPDFFFFFLNQNICCGYSKEQSHRLDETVLLSTQKNMLKLMDKKTIAILRYFFLNWPYADTVSSAHLFSLSGKDDGYSRYLPDTNIQANLCS